MRTRREKEKEKEKEMARAARKQRKRRRKSLYRIAASLNIAPSICVASLFLSLLAEIGGLDDEDGVEKDGIFIFLFLN